MATLPMQTANVRPANWQKIKGVDVVSYDDGSVWSLDVQLESGERIGLELSKLSLLGLSSAVAQWKELMKSSPTGRGAFSKPAAK